MTLKSMNIPVPRLIVYYIHCTVGDEDLRVMLVRKDELIQEMTQLLAEFYSNVSTQYVALTSKHRKEWRLVVSSLVKERKSCLQKERRQNAKMEKEEQNARTCRNRKLFLDDPSRL